MKIILLQIITLENIKHLYSHYYSTLPPQPLKSTFIYF